MTVGSTSPATVHVAGQDVAIKVSHTSKTIWRAHGTLEGKHYAATGSSYNSAISAWKKVADYGSKA